MKRNSTESCVRAWAATVSATILGLALLLGEGSTAKTPPRVPNQGAKLKDPQFIAEGAQLFAPVCGTGYCHGTGGVGGSAPKLRGEDMEAGFIFDIVSNGIPGSSMPAFKSVFTEEQRWKMVAFVMSPLKEGEAKSKGPATAVARAGAKPDPSTAALPLVGDARAGKEIFFDSAQSKSCQSCHTFDGAGTSIGPDLSKVGNRSAKDLFLGVVLPREKADPRYSNVRLTLADGEKLVGIVKEEDDQTIRVYDLTQLPAVLRTISKSKIAKTETLSESSMPRDYAGIYTMKELLDLVAFLKSSDPQSKSPVTLKDLF